MAEINNIFKYNDGFSDIYGDPFEIDYRFEQAVIEGNIDLDLLNDRINELPKDENGEIDQARCTKAHERLFTDSCHKYIPLIRAALEMKPFDKKTGLGLQSIDVLKTWTDYMNWKIKLKKNTGSQPDSAMPTTASGPSISGGSMASSTNPVHSQPRQSMGSIST